MQNVLIHFDLNQLDLSHRKTGPKTVNIHYIRNTKLFTITIYFLQTVGLS